MQLAAGLHVAVVILRISMVAHTRLAELVSADIVIATILWFIIPLMAYLPVIVHTIPQHQLAAVVFVQLAPHGAILHGTQVVTKLITKELQPAQAQQEDVHLLPYQI